MEEGFVGEIIREFEAAQCPDAGFERMDAEETPFGVGDDLGEGAFAVSGGSKFGEMAVDVLLVDEGVVCR